MDGAIGQTAETQAKHFKQAVNVGSIVLTKMDSGNSKGGGALSAVAATKSPILFIGTGEHLNDLEKFEVKGFISQMLGMGNLGGLVEKFQDMQLDQPGFMKHMETGVFTFHDLREQIQTILNLGPLSKVMNMIPGMPDLGQQGDAMGQKKLRHLISMMDSMTQQELTDTGDLFQTQPSRLDRIARGSGSSRMEVNLIMDMHRQFASMVKTMGGKNGLVGKLQGTLDDKEKKNY
ncbi:Signal recognition particle [Coelomomyces lativittatus]|nr:Signal recognition particle [Coelomomyces lativittatus]